MQRCGVSGCYSDRVYCRWVFIDDGMKDLYGKEISKERMDEYYAELEAFEKRMHEKKPRKENYGFMNGMFPDEASERAYNNAYAEWDMAFSCDAPNMPGYYRANND